jgi:hypothetical protein
VEGDIAAAVDLEQLDAALGQKLGRRQYMIELSIASQGDDRLVFQKEQSVVDAASLAKLHQRPLQVKRGVIRDQAEMENVDHEAALSIWQLAFSLHRIRYVQAKQRSSFVRKALKARLDPRNS